MFGPLICYATDCTSGLTGGQFVVGILIAVGVVAGIVVLVKWLDRGNDD